VARSPFQVLVLPYRRGDDGDYEFAVFRRTDDATWQGIAGGGEDDEAPLEAARREAAEEAGVPLEAAYLPLDSIASVQVTCFRDSHLWGDDLYVIPEYSFGVGLSRRDLVLSDEHTEVRWVRFGIAAELLRYDSNRVALWELNQKIRGLGPRDTPTG
jgi:dihydroneopterin triphosphate diphosphatase